MNRESDKTSAGRAGHALLQPGERDEAAAKSCAPTRTAPDALTTRVAVARKIAKVLPWSASADGLSVIACWRSAASRREICCSEGMLAAGRCRRHQSSACHGRSRWAISPASDIGWRSRKDRGIKSEIADALCEAGRLRPEDRQGHYKYGRRLARAAARSEVES